MKNETPKEEWEQEQIFRWAYSNQIRVPELQLCNGSMNGVYVTPKIRAKLKAQGLRPGVPDIDLPVKRFPYTGLHIELKRVKGGRVSKEQKRFHQLLEQQGRKVEVCKGWIEAVCTMIDYLDCDLKKPVAI
jgi:hypothetical protein